MFRKQVAVDAAVTTDEQRRERIEKLRQQIAADVAEIRVGLSVVEQHCREANYLMMFGSPSLKDAANLKAEMHDLRAEVDRMRVGLEVAR